MRIYNEHNDALDYCISCYPIAKEEYLIELNNISDEYWSSLNIESGITIEEFINHVENNGDVNLHPEYDDCDYDCEECGKKLTNKD